MADLITTATKELNADSSVKQWHISYHVESDSNVNEFVVVIKAEDMTDPASASEAKSLANIEATAKKAAWVNSLSEATSIESEASIEGSVTLS